MSDIEKALARLRRSAGHIENEHHSGGLIIGSNEHEVEKHRDVPRSDSVSAIPITPDYVLDEVSDIPLRSANRASQKRGVAAPARHGASVDSTKVNAIVGKNPILELPLQALLKDGFLVPDTPKGRLTEEYRRIKRPLLKNLRNNSLPRNNIIMVTSSVSGEGKTYTAINLAMSFALERDRTVLLIDGDVIRGSAGKTLGVAPGAIGLTDLLSNDESDIGDAIMPTNVASLSLIPAGSEHELANELLSSQRMNDRIDELAARYNDRIIIIDSPPILQTNEANIITEYAGQVVFVVAESQTPQRTVTQALAHIDSDKYVGILVNKSSSAGKTYGYDYGYA